MEATDMDLQPLLAKDSHHEADDSNHSGNSNHSHNNNNNNKSTNNNNNNNNNVNNNKHRKDINRNLVQERNLSFSRKSLKLRYIWKRKPLVYLLAIALLIFLVNVTYNRDEDEAGLMGSEDDLNFLNHIHSHVPGMKVIRNLTSLLQTPSLLHRVPIPAAPSGSAVHPSHVERQHQRMRAATATASTRASRSNATATDDLGHRNAKHATPSNTNNLSLTLSNSLFPLPAPAINGNETLASPVPPPKGYLVWSEFCKMPNLDPYLPEVMKNFHRDKYKACKLLPPLTWTEFNRTSGRYVLRIDDDALPGYSKTGKVDCCYQSIVRDGTGSKADSQISFTDCMSFHDGTSLDSSIDNILVKCRSNNKQVYVNGHPMMPERKDIRERLHKWRKYDQEQGSMEKPPSVLMLGIDSISRVNLIRAMPKTARYLYENEWYEMSGFNKIDDNTFPNLMAVLTGMNRSTIMEKCSPYVLNALDECDFIWKTYREHGYVTAYAEDEASINTFNYLKVGFTQPPVDYYLRPFLLGAEKHLETRLKSGLISCLGYKHAADFVYDYAVELARRYRNDTFFGLFWANTFSHNDISDCTAMDEHIVEYLRKFKTMGTLENTIVIFFSDHGMRFGPIRKTYSGHLEERLPFVFVWLPQRLKNAYPGFVNALNVNKNRLTNPYDTHMTLKHILALSQRVTNNEKLNRPSACPRCQSLLQPVPQNRSCQEAAIEPHWCTCLLYENIYKNSKTVVNLTHLLVDYINDYVATFHNKSYAKLCAPLKYDSMESAYRTTQLRMDDAAPGPGSTIDIYRVTFYTKPNKGLFEATAFYDPLTGYMKVTGEISRLNTYASDSSCVSDGGAKKYCSCRKKIF